MPDRIPCCIPGCRCTCKGAIWDEWICQKHWQRIPKAMRRVYSRALRKAKRLGWNPAVDRLWLRCKREAIERNFMDLV